MSNLGVGVMINMLAGNEESVDCFTSVVGQKIARVWLDKDADALRFVFENGERIRLFDNGQSCCEKRYMTTDDDLSVFAGAELHGAEIKDGPTQDDEWGEPHEIQFLEVQTDRGVFTMETHNEHNGYYGGFWVVCKPDTDDDAE